MGHQFGAGHTQNEDCQRSSSSSMEPGAGTTIMSYVTSLCDNQIQNIPDYYFHAISIEQMSARMLNTTCAAFLPNTNSAPTISAGPDVTVPSETPLLLKATYSDLDDDPMTFTWEQYDNEVAEAIPPASTNTQGPNFRSYPPTIESDRYLPNLADVIDGTTPTWEVLSSVARTMEFRVTVRDNSLTSMSCTAEDDIVITTVAEGPFLVTSPSTSGVIWIEGETHTVSWDVAGTDIAPVSCSQVDILLSYDGGLTYPTILADTVTNNGTADVVVPFGISTTARVQVRCSDNIFYNISASDFEIELTDGPTFLLDLPEPVTNICPGDNPIDIPVTSAIFSGFNGNITLSATDLPGNSILTFDSTTITGGLATTFEISNTTDLAEGTYPITISGTDGSIVRNLNFLLSVSLPGDIVVLDLPADNAVDLGLNPQLSWLPDSEATAYEVQISLDPNFASLELSEIVTTNSFLVDMSLEGSTLYYWRVKVSNACDSTPWSLSREFTTGNCLGSFVQNTPVIIFPSGPQEVNSVLTVTGSGTIEALTVSNIIGTHTYTSDLAVRLIGPGGSPEVLLWDGDCGSTNDFNLSISDDAVDPVSDAPCNPLGQGGTYLPVDPLAVFNGLPIAGDWTLRINDNFNLDGGELASWSLDFCLLTFLPVDLLSFEATALKNEIQLDWETANEFENKGFEIQRRTDAEREFTTIGDVSATNDVQQINYYEFLDKEVKPGVQYYYRLKQNEFDGQYEYSEIRAASIKGSELGLQVYPNPVRGELFGSLNIESGLEAELQLHDLHGRIVKEQLASGNEFIMNLEGLPAGVYVLKARHLAGEEIVRLVVR